MIDSPQETLRERLKISDVAGVVSQQVLEKYGISLLLSKPTRTVEKCHDLLGQAGFESIDIKPEPDGNYIRLDNGISLNRLGLKIEKAKLLKVTVRPKAKTTRP
jgi:hypothetical protein